jgi:adenosylcobinamide-GDP ribazoletransferase
VSLFEALAFLTIAGRGQAPSTGAVRWFGPVGAAVGAVLGLAWWGAAAVWAAPLAAALVVAADLVATGMLHVDGLADSADGLLPHLSRPRRLAVMSGPEVGAFGVAVVAVTLLLRFAALASFPSRQWHAVVLLAGLWAGSRTVAAVAVCALPYARRPGGLASSFRGASAAGPVLLGAPLALAGAALGRGWGGLAALAAVVVGGAIVLALGRRRLGGFTGDVLGAAIVVGETAGLIVAAARW